MSRQLGAFDPDDQLDRPDLNKCPDCGCYFATVDCPLCGRECPPEMRAGARVEPKVKRKKTGSSSGRVQFIPWYHSWWFILIMMFIFPLAGVVLLATSPYQKKWKIVFITLAVVILVLEYTGLGSLLIDKALTGRKPVNKRLGREQYVETCTSVEAQDYFRSGSVKGYYSMELTVDCTVSRDDTWTVSPYAYANGELPTVYLCHDPDDPAAYVFVLDYQLDSPVTLRAGDRITVYGQSAGESAVSIEVSDETVTAPRLYAAYIELIK